MPEPMVLLLEDGFELFGERGGQAMEASGEVVINTCMTGYQEVLSDPSYAGQMVVMTYPLIGNYGATADFQESARPWALAQPSVTSRMVGRVRHPDHDRLRHSPVGAASSNDGCSTRDHRTAPGTRIPAGTAPAGANARRAGPGAPGLRRVQRRR